MTEQQKLVAKQETKSCGCDITTFSDESVQVSPCLPCAMIEAARHMQMAAQALGAGATKVAQDRHNQQAMMNMAAKLGKKA